MVLLPLKETIRFPIAWFAYPNHNQCGLQSRGYKVRIRKLDPYLNIDPGTMNPYEHGEVYVTEDGGLRMSGRVAARGEEPFRGC